MMLNDCLIIHHVADTAMHELDHLFKMKSGSIGDPNLYPGAKLRKVLLENGVEVWATSA